MATARRKSSSADDQPKPTDVEVNAAIRAWLDAYEALEPCRDRELQARQHLVDVLHRVGLKGFVL